MAWDKHGQSRVTGCAQIMLPLYESDQPVVEVSVQVFLNSLKRVGRTDSLFPSLGIVVGKFQSPKTIADTKTIRQLRIPFARS